MYNAHMLCFTIPLLQRTAAQKQKMLHLLKAYMEEKGRTPVAKEVYQGMIMLLRPTTTSSDLCNSNYTNDTRQHHRLRLKACLTRDISAAIC